MGRGRGRDEKEKSSLSICIEYFYSNCEKSVINIITVVVVVAAAINACCLLFFDEFCVLNCQMMFSAVCIFISLTGI